MSTLENLIQGLEQRIREHPDWGMKKELRKQANNLRELLRRHPVPRRPPPRVPPRQ